MPIHSAKPEFGGKLMTADYYSQVLAIVAVLREHSTLRNIAAHLTAQGFVTPSGLPFTRDRLATFLKQNEIKGA
jgi:hypothetical protein